MLFVVCEFADLSMITSTNAFGTDSQHGQQNATTSYYNYTETETVVIGQSKDHILYKISEKVCTYIFIY